MIKGSTTGMVVSFKTDLWFPIPGQQRHGTRIIQMDPYEFKTFMDIVERYSTAFKSAKGNGRGKKKRK